MDLNKRLRQNNDRFVLAISSILERYNQPFEDDFLISMETLTYETADGPKSWGQVSTKQLKEWKQEVFKCKRRIHRNAEMSKQETSDFEDGHSTVHQESPEISAMETSDIDEENDTSMAVVSRNDGGSCSQNLFGHDGKIPEIVKVDPIVQEYGRKIPEWMTVAPQASSVDLPLALPGQELSGNQAAVCRREGLPNECSPSGSLELQFPSVLISPNAITMQRHPPYPELHSTCCDSSLEDDQPGAEECSWSNLTLADLYPVMVEIFTRRVTKHSLRRQLKYMFGHFRCRRWRSRASKLNVTVDKRGLRPVKMKQALPSICSSRREDIQNKTFECENRELRDGNCSTNDSSALVPYPCIGTNGSKVNCCDSSLEQHLAFGKGQNASREPLSLDNIVRMGKTSVAEEKLQAASLETSEDKQSENLAHKCSSEGSCIASAASSGSAVVHSVNKSSTQPDLPCGDTSELCSSPYSSCGSRNTSTSFTSSTSFTNSCQARTSNTLLVNPQKVISERENSFQRRNSLSSLSMKQRPSETAQKYEDAFEKLYNEVSSKENPPPLALTGPHSNSQNPEEKGRWVKSNFRVSVRSDTEFDRAFDRIYEQLCSEPSPKLPGLQRALSCRRYEGIQMSETVNALVNSPVRASSRLLGVKRQGHFQPHLWPTVKRVRNVPDCSWPSPKRQQTSCARVIRLRAVGMDFLSTHSSSSSPTFSASHACQSQHSGFQASTDKFHLSLPGTSLQESGISGAHSPWPKGKTVLAVVPKLQKRLTEEYPEK